MFRSHFSLGALTFGEDCSNVDLAADCWVSAVNWLFADTHCMFEIQEISLEIRGSDKKL